MRVVITILCAFIGFNSFGQFKSYYDNSNNVRFEADTLNNMLNGEFRFKDKNNIDLIKGYFKNNQRFGIWTYKNKDGQIIDKRDYINDYRTS